MQFSPKAEEFAEEGAEYCWQLFAPDGCTMSRRKQSKPQQINSDEPESSGNGKFALFDVRAFKRIEGLRHAIDILSQRVCVFVGGQLFCASLLSHFDLLLSV